MARRPTVRIGRKCDYCGAQHDTDARRCSSCGEIATASQLAVRIREPDPENRWSVERSIPVGGEPPRRSTRSFSPARVRPRAVTEPQAGQANDGNDDLWLENQELHDKILDLESRLEEVEADNGELQALAQTMDDKCKRRMSMRRVSFALPMKRSPSENEKVDELKVQRVRLLWQSAISAVRLQNSNTTKNILKLIVSGLKVQHQEAREELQQKLKHSVQASEQQSRSQAETTQLINTLSEEKVALEQALKDQTFAVERSAHLGVAANLEVSLLEECGGLTQLSPSKSLADDIKDAGTFSSTPLAGLALSQALSPTDSAPASLRGLLNELGRENDELKRYTRTLERELEDAVIDHEEMDALRCRVRQLEKVAWAVEPAQASQGQHGAEGRTSAWCAFTRTICTAGRSGNTSFDNPPFVLSGATASDDGSLPGSSASSALQPKLGVA